MSSPEYADQIPEADTSQPGQKLPGLETDFYEAFFIQASTGALPIHMPDAEPAASPAAPESSASAHHTLEMPSWRLMSDGEGAGSVDAVPAADEKPIEEDGLLVSKQLSQLEGTDEGPFLEGVLISSGDMPRRHRPVGRIVLAAAALVVAGGTAAIALDKAPGHGTVGAAVGQAVAATTPSASPTEVQTSTPSAPATPKAPATPPGPEAILLPSDSPFGMEFTAGSNSWLVDTMGSGEVQLTPPGDTRGTIVALGKKVTIADPANGKTYVVKVALNEPSKNSESAKSATVYVYGQQG